MKAVYIVLAGLAFTLSVSVANANDQHVGKVAFEKYACVTCHGADAKTSTQPEYPVLAGQHKDYLKQSLSAYQRGQTNAPASANVRKNAIMGAMAAQLSVQDIENISAWLSGLSSPLSTQR